MRVRFPHCLLLAAAFLAGASFAWTSRAESKNVQFIVEEPSAFSNRLRAEIEAMGFGLVPAQVAGESSASVVAIVRVADSPALRRVEVWISNGASGRLDLGAVVQPSPDDDDDLQTVKASEQLRALLQPLRESTALAEQPPPASPESPAAPLPPPAAPLFAPPVPPPAPPPGPSGLRRFSAAASIAIPFQPGGPGVDMMVRGRWLLTPEIGVGGALAVPVSGGTLHDGVNAADVTASLLDAELSYALFDTRALELTMLAGVGVAWVRTKGQATAPYTSQSDHAFVALPLAGVEVAPGLAEHVRLCLGARIGFAIPRADIAFAGETIATWGRPFALLSAGVGVEL